MSAEQVNEIFNYFDCGFICFVHREKGNLIFIPDIPVHQINKKIWNDELEAINNQPDNYIEIDRLDFSIELLKVMENFIETVPDMGIQDKLQASLKKILPHRYFEIEIGNYEFYKQKWFDFKSRQLLEWVKKQIH